MKIAVIGAAGKAGSLIVKEALSRGHEVTALVRDGSKINEANVRVVEKDVFQLTAEDVKEFDAVVNAFGAAPGQEHQHVEAGKVLIQALQGTPNTRLLVVGGAGSLFVDEQQTTRLMNTPEFPALYFATASNQGQNLADLQASQGIRWTFLSPAAFFNPEGKKTGAYRKGKDNLIVNAAGNSYISYADYAIAVLDELENPQHINERFTVVGEAE